VQCIDHPYSVVEWRERIGLGITPFPEEKMLWTE